MAAVCSGASGVLEYAGGVGPTGAGICQRPSLCLPCEATDFCLFYLYWSRLFASNSATTSRHYTDTHWTVKSCPKLKYLVMLSIHCWNISPLHLTHLYYLGTWQPIQGKNNKIGKNVSYFVVFILNLFYSFLFKWNLKTLTTYMCFSYIYINYICCITSFNATRFMCMVPVK